MGPLGWLAAAALLFAAVFVGLAWYGAGCILYDPWRKKHDELDPGAFGLEFEDAAFRNSEGLTLRGWLVRPKKAGPKRLVVVCHGWGTNKAFMLPRTQFLASKGGYHLFYFDSRGCGRSDGRKATIGYLETFDLDAALDWLRTRHPELLEKAGIYGMSMGGAMAVVGMARHPELRCGAAEAAFTSYNAVVDRWHRVRGIFPNFPFIDLVKRFVALRVGADPETLAPIRHIDAVGERPMLYMTGDRDWLMPVSESELLHERSRGPKELWIVPGADHEDCNQDAEAYEGRVLGFYGKHL